MNFNSLTIANGEADLELLNKACILLSTSSDEAEIENIHQILTKFCERPDCFDFCFPIINGEFHTYTKFLAFQIIKKNVLDNWFNFQEDDKTKIRTEILVSIVKMVKEGQKYFTVSMANQSLIEVLKFDWPEKWPSFIDELVATCQNEGILFLKNGLDILKMLADEVSSSLTVNHLTKDRVRAIQSGFIKEFFTIYSLIENAFNSSTQSEGIDPDDIFEIETKALNTFSSLIPVVKSEQLLESSFVSNIAPLIQDDRFVFSVFSIFGKFCEYISESDTDNSLAKQFQQSLLSVFQESIHQIYSTYGETVNFNCVEYDDFLILVSCVYEFLHLFVPILETSEYNSEITTAIGWIIQSCTTDYIDKNDDLSLFSEVIKFWNFISKIIFRSASQEANPFHEIFLDSITYVIPFLVQNIVSPYTVIEISGTSNHFHYYLSTNSYESTLYDTMKETFIILYGLKKNDLSNAISMQVDNLKADQYNANTINSICWTVGSISKAASDEENSDLMGIIIPILIGIVQTENETDDPTLETIKITASQGLLFLCSQEAKYFQSNPDFLSSLVQIILKFLVSDDSSLIVVAIHTLNLLSKSCKQAFITPIEPSNTTILDDILSVFTEKIMQIRPENRGSFVSIIADIVRFAQSISQEEGFIPSFSNFLDQISNIFSQSCSLIEDYLNQFQNGSNLAQEAINSFGNIESLSLSTECSFQPPTLLPLESLKSMISSLNLLIPIPLSMHSLFLPFFETIWHRLIDIYESATNNSNMIFLTDFTEGYDDYVAPLAHSTLDSYLEIANCVAELLMNTLNITKQDQSQFLQVIFSSFFLGFNYNSINPQCYSPNLLAMYGTLFQFTLNFDTDNEELRLSIVKMFIEFFDNIFMPTTEVIKDEYDTFYDLRTGMSKLIRGNIRGRPDLIFQLNEDQVDVFVHVLFWLSKHPYEEISNIVVESIFFVFWRLS